MMLHASLHVAPCPCTASQVGHGVSSWKAIDLYESPDLDEIRQHDGDSDCPEVKSCVDPARITLRNQAFD